MCKADSAEHIIGRPAGTAAKIIMQDDCKVRFGRYPVDLARVGCFPLGRTPMSIPAAPTLLAALQELTDPRRRRGVRHPFAAVLALTFLGLLCRRTDFATIARWAKAHW